MIYRNPVILYFQIVDFDKNIVNHKHHFWFHLHSVPYTCILVKICQNQTKVKDVSRSFCLSTAVSNKIKFDTQLLVALILLFIVTSLECFDNTTFKKMHILIKMTLVEYLIFKGVLQPGNIYIALIICNLLFKKNTVINYF